MNVYNDKRIVLTLDAGGTNFVFNAMQQGKLLFEPYILPANADNLNKCLNGLIGGFKHVKSKLENNPGAISFAFPGPADYDKGIIGDLPNFPAFKGGVAMGSMLSEFFDLPVFIQNDGNLFAYGEAIAGTLRDLNSKLDNKCKNLIGLTLGTGFGAGLVFDGKLVTGNNSIAGEVWLTSNRITPEWNIEEGVSTRAILNYYNNLEPKANKNLMPYDVFQIAKGEKEGNQNAAVLAFERFGVHMADAIANLVTLFDGIVVIGGGLTGAASLFMPVVIKELNGSFKSGQKRLVHHVFNLNDQEDMQNFIMPSNKTIEVPFSSSKIEYDPVQKMGITISNYNASEMISIGAYAFALNNL